MTRAACAAVLVLLLGACSSNHKATSPSTQTSTSASPSTSFVSPLKPGPYGFLIPRTWQLEPTADGARLRNLSGAGTIDYRVVPPPSDLAQAARCSITSSRATRADRTVFTCAPTPDGERVDGVLINTPRGAKVLVITLPAGERDVAMSIAASFRI